MGSVAVGDDWQRSTVLNDDNNNTATDKEYRQGRTYTGIQ